jgi:hypothetical protein
VAADPVLEVAVNDEGIITLIEGPLTPDHYRYGIGRKTPPISGGVPSPGWRGHVFGIPGVMRGDNQFEIREEDMRTEAEKLLDEADELLRAEPNPGDRVEVVATRHTRAALLLLRAQSKILRAMERGR